MSTPTAPGPGIGSGLNSIGGGGGSGSAAACNANGTMEGMLNKWVNVMQGWQFRFFVLDENAGLLSYYTSRENMMKGVRRGCVRLKNAVIGIDDSETFTFTITVDHKTFHFQALNREERERWVQRLEDTIQRHAMNRPRLLADSRGKCYPSGGGGYREVVGGRRPNHLEALGRRVSEADAYLQLMIEQIKVLDKRIAEVTDPEELAKCKVLQERANAMLDHIKHSIVSLQIAKNMAHPINGIYTGPISPRPTPTSTAAATPTTPEHAMATKKRDKIAGQTTLDVDDDEGEDEDSTTETATTAPLTVALSVPVRSYSSSEGEEDFYDAYDETYNSPSPSSSPVDQQLQLTSSGSSSSSQNATRNMGEQLLATTTSKDAPAATTTTTTTTTNTHGHQPNQTTSPATQQRTNASTPTTTTTIAATNEPQSTTIAPTSAAGHFRKSSTPSSDNGIDYDALYEEEDDGDISMEAHGSMITHLLSQVKIGMDLTKVVLPTFILERRSLLEMYADYFAHPDLFLRIADLDTPRERMVQVCRWYLSAYHAGRKSAVAKKPYNPILGEVFKCHWNIENENANVNVNANGDTRNSVKDGPVPWCQGNQLTFLAEQVSHHPPISAFYAEHYDKRITFCAHVWTKSKFLGLSVGVHNVGEGIVTLVDRHEEYIVTFPNGYGRSILTVPWIELGGSIEIKCPQTGYYANVEFLTKPFYGGKRNKITAEIYSPNEKKPFVSIAGEWSGQMEAKWHDKNKTEMFIDVNSIPVYKKQVRPIAEQDSFESRRVWKEVTAGLKFNDIERATNAKSVVEQSQREEAKVRKDFDLAWEQKYFKPVGSKWIYANPLSQRIYQQDRDSKR